MEVLLLLHNVSITVSSSPYYSGNEKDEAKRARTASEFLEASLFLFGRKLFFDFELAHSRSAAVSGGGIGGGGVLGGCGGILCGGGHG